MSAHMPNKSIEEEIILRRLVAAKNAGQEDRNPENDGAVDSDWGWWSRPDDLAFDKDNAQVGRIADLPDVHEFDRFSMLARGLADMRRKSAVTAEKPIVAYRKNLKNAVVFVKKFLRRYLRWYVEPPWQQQSEFNRTTVETVERVGHEQETQHRYVHALTTAATEQDKTITELETKAAHLAEIAEAVSPLSELTDKRDALLSLARMEKPLRRLAENARKLETLAHEGDAVAGLSRKSPELLALAGSQNALSELAGVCGQLLALVRHGDALAELSARKSDLLHIAASKAELDGLLDNSDIADLTKNTDTLLGIAARRHELTLVCDAVDSLKMLAGDADALVALAREKDSLLELAHNDNTLLQLGRSAANLDPLAEPGTVDSLVSLARNHANLLALAGKSDDAPALRASHAEMRDEQHRIVERLSLMEKTLDELRNGSVDGNHDISECYSQSGEDQILLTLLALLGLAPANVAYLDLGANHAKKYSNTYQLYEKGSRGVLVEANPKLIPELKLWRAEDTVLNLCVAEKSGETIAFHTFLNEADGLSTTSSARAAACLTKDVALEVGDTIMVETISPNDLLDSISGDKPLVVNIDIEGGELDVLKSIDFSKYRPLVFIVEMIEYNPGKVSLKRNMNILRFMKNVGYVEYAFTGINSIFLDRRRVNEVEQ